MLWTTCAAVDVHSECSCCTCSIPIPAPTHSFTFLLFNPNSSRFAACRRDLDCTSQCPNRNVPADVSSHSLNVCTWPFFLILRFDTASFTRLSTYIRVRLVVSRLSYSTTTPLHHRTYPPSGHSAQASRQRVQRHVRFANMSLPQVRLPALTTATIMCLWLASTIKKKLQLCLPDACCSSRASLPAL